MGRKPADFWKYGKRLNKKFQCGYCQKILPGGIIRFEAHLSGIKGQGIQVCTRVPDDVREEAKLKLGKDNSEPSSSNSITPSSEICDSNCSNEVDNLIAKFFEMNDINCNAVQSPSFVSLVDALVKLGPSYDLPSVSKLERELIPSFRREVELYICRVEQSWEETGCTLVSNIWCDDDRGTFFLSIIGCSRVGAVLLNISEIPNQNELTGAFLEITPRVIEEVGAHKVVQCVVDDTQCVESFRDLLLKEFPHVHVTKGAASHDLLSEETCEQVKWVRTTAAFLNPAFMCTERAQKGDMNGAINYMLEKFVAADDQQGFVDEVVRYQKMFAEEYKTYEIIAAKTEWWIYCGKKFPILRNYAIRILNLPCSNACCKNSLREFEAYHIKKRRRVLELNDLKLKMNEILMEKHSTKVSQSEKLALEEFVTHKPISGSSSAPSLQEMQPCSDEGSTYSDVLRSEIPSEGCRSPKYLKLYFNTAILTPLGTGQNVEGVQVSKITVFLVDPASNAVVQDGIPSTLMLTVAVLDDSFDQASSYETWTRKDFDDNDLMLKQEALVSGSLSVTLEQGVGTLGDFCFNYSSQEATTSGKFRLAVKTTTATGDCQGIRILEGISTAFEVHGEKVMRTHHPAATEMYLQQDSTSLGIGGLMRHSSSQETFNNSICSPGFWTIDFDNIWHNQYQQRGKSTKLVTRRVKMQRNLRWRRGVEGLDEEIRGHQFIRPKIVEATSQMNINQEEDSTENDDIPVTSTECSSPMLTSASAGAMVPLSPDSPTLSLFPFQLASDDAESTKEEEHEVLNPIVLQTEDDVKTQNEVMPGASKECSTMMSTSATVGNPIPPSLDALALTLFPFQLAGYDAESVKEEDHEVLDSTLVQTGDDVKTRNEVMTGVSKECSTLMSTAATVGDPIPLSLDAPAPTLFPSQLAGNDAESMKKEDHEVLDPTVVTTEDSMKAENDDTPATPKECSTLMSTSANARSLMAPSLHLPALIHPPESTSVSKIFHGVMEKTRKWLKNLVGSKKDRDKEKTKNSRRSMPCQKKHALEVAAATAAAANAAAAAAQAAAAVIRLTAGTASRTSSFEEAAAIRIQSAYRSHLARKALRALRGIVKLQALVRGHLVRKQVTAMLRCMQTLVTAQARARGQRIRMGQESKSLNPRSSFHRKSTRDDRFKHTNHETEKLMEENIKIVGMDIGESKFKLQNWIVNKEKKRTNTQNGSKLTFAF